MARYIKPKLKLYKRENIDFFKNKSFKLKENYENLNIDTDNYSNYYCQLREKQKLKLIYGIMDKQFYSYYLKSKKLNGNSVRNLLWFLERRLDNVIYKMGFSSTRFEARQIITHRCVYVNNIIVNIPSKLVDLGEIIKIKINCQKQDRINKSLNLCKVNNLLPSWIFINFKKYIGYLRRYPLTEELSININENLILNSYFK